MNSVVTKMNKPSAGFFKRLAGSRAVHGFGECLMDEDEWRATSQFWAYFRYCRYFRCNVNNYTDSRYTKVQGSRFYKLNTNRGTK